LRELIIKISANSQSFQSEIQRASRMGSEYYRTLQNGGRQAAAAARDQRRALAELNSQLTEIRGSAVGMAGAFAGAFATGHLISLADEWSSVNARLKQASQSSDEFSSSQKVLMDISQRTGTAFSDNAALFARSAASMREYGYSADDVLKVTEAISTGLKISGASTAEAGSVITQFSQALAQGVLRGEEFNSVNESGDRIVRALAAGMGVARKDLKAMADDGQLTADKVVPALISQLEVLRDEYAAMPETVSDGITKVENAFMAWVGGANEASGVTKTLSGVLNGVAGQIDNVATAVGALVAVGVARYFGNMASGAMSATAGLVTAARNEVALAEAQFRGTQMTNHWVDIKNANVVMVMGGNAAEAHPVGFRWAMEAKNNNDATLIVVDPRFTRTASVADIYAPIRSGTDITFLSGVLRYLIENDKINAEYVKHYTNASLLVRDDFAFEDGLFSGYD
ncbi:tape measure protein, partial [Escherichia coli]|uniref:tape measure protein n=1 Tax=Escherichia coli TaxID=562 RepID=UPI001FCB434A